MSKNLTDSRKRWLQYKKDNPFGTKWRFIRSHIFNRFKSYANRKLNGCGWMFEDGSFEHNLWKLHHCEIEEMERIYTWRIHKYEETHGRGNFKPTEELRSIFEEYLHKAYILYKKTLVFHDYHCYYRGEVKFYLSWFEKNIKKIDSYKNNGNETQNASVRCGEIEKKD